MPHTSIKLPFMIEKHHSLDPDNLTGKSGESAANCAKTPALDQNSAIGNDNFPRKRYIKKKLTGFDEKMVSTSPHFIYELD